MSNMSFMHQLSCMLGNMPLLGLCQGAKTSCQERIKLYHESDLDVILYHRIHMLGVLPGHYYGISHPNY
jgi:hypothetical protein